MGTFTAGSGQGLPCHCHCTRVPSRGPIHACGRTRLWAWTFLCIPRGFPSSPGPHPLPAGGISQSWRQPESPSNSSVGPQSWAQHHWLRTNEARPHCFSDDESERWRKGLWGLWAPARVRATPAKGARGAPAAANTSHAVLSQQAPYCRVAVKGFGPPRPQRPLPLSIWMSSSQKPLYGLSFKIANSHCQTLRTFFPADFLYNT